MVQLSLVKPVWEAVKSRLLLLAAVLRLLGEVLATTVSLEENSMRHEIQLTNRRGWKCSGQAVQPHLAQGDQHQRPHAPELRIRNN
jgi:hypothetical protein